MGMVYEVIKRKGLMGTEEKELVLSGENHSEKREICKSEGEFLLLGKEYVPYRDQSAMQQFAEANHLFLMETY